MRSKTEIQEEEAILVGDIQIEFYPGGGLDVPKTVKEARNHD